jgi:hypothetical protein
MTDRPVYGATATRDDWGWWEITIPELDTTQARRLDQAEQAVREVVILRRNLPEDDTSFDVFLEAVLPEHTAKELAAVRDAHKEAEAARRSASDLTRRFVTNLQNELGLSTRDIGRILGVSHQRAAQLAKR